MKFVAATIVFAGWTCSFFTTLTIQGANVPPLFGDQNGVLMNPMARARVIRYVHTYRYKRILYIS